MDNVKNAVSTPKHLTLKELSVISSIAVGTIRSWTLKPKAGLPYNPALVNYVALHEGLNRYFEDELFETKLGFKITDIVIVKGERSTKSYVDLSEINVGATVMLHNYSLQTEMVFVGTYQAKLPETLVNEREVAEVSGTLTLYIFNCAKGGYKCYTEQELSKPNIKLQLV